MVEEHIHVINKLVKYRSDIDGLRAVAVLSVIFFHINPNWLTGGYFGVDIFFVISGYLITLILVKEIKKTKKLNIINFYKRRVKRIAPALFFLLTFTSIVGYILLTPQDLVALADATIWAVFSSANIYFYTAIDTGYFAPNSDTLPLLQLWSLGVEEQFYIFWPLVLLLVMTFFNSFKKMMIFLIVVFIASLVLAQATVLDHQQFAYYMIPTRAWELLGGAIVAILVNFNIHPKGLLSEIMAIVGLVAIIFSVVFLTNEDPVPSLYTVPVIIGTAILIFSGAVKQTLVGKLLSFKPFVLIGLISYPAYLWHWSILAFLRYASVQINFTVVLFIFFATFLMATISYLFVERPLRTRDTSTKNVFIWYLLVPATVIVSASGAVKSHYEGSKETLSYQKFEIKPAYEYNYNCQFNVFDLKAYSAKRCIYPQNAKKADAFLIGDSNAAHYVGMLRVLAQHYGFSIRNASQSACPPVFDEKFSWVNHTYKKGCDIYTQSLPQEVLKYNTVLLGGEWEAYFYKKGFKKGFEKTIDYLAKHVKHVIILLEVPSFPPFDNKCEQKALKIKSLHCETAYNNKNPDTNANKFMRQIAKKYANVDTFEIRHLLCKKDGTCSPYLDGMPIYYDGWHLNMKGSELLGRKMIISHDPELKVFEQIKK